MPKNVRLESMQEVVRVSVVLVRWRTLSFYRTLLYRVRHTLQGKIGVAISVMIAAMLMPYLVWGFIDELPVTEAGLNGLLLMAHLWLALTLALMVLVQYTKTFLKDRFSEPLAAHPSHAPALNRHRALAAMPLATVVFTGLFFVYFLQLLVERLEHLAIAIPVHLLAIALLVISSSAVVGFLGRKVLRTTIERGLKSEDRFVNAIGTVAIGTFSVVLLGIIYAIERAPGVLEWIGNDMAFLFPFGMAPLLAASAADEGRWLAVTAWLGLSAALALWAVRATYRWSFSAHREIPIDLAIPLYRAFSPVFSGQPGHRLPRGLVAFWRKDIVAPYTREPKRYLFHHVNLLWWGIMSVVVAMALRNRSIITPPFAETIPVLATLVAVALCAIQNGVNALGREGKELTWLRSIFTGSELLGRKLLVNLTYTLTHGVVYALIVAIASRAASLGTSTLSLIAYAVGAGVIFSCLSTCIGFLLPDFGRRRSSLPGSTTLGKGGYMSSSLILISITGTAHLLLAAGVFDAAKYAGLMTFAGICAAVGSVLIAGGALRQYEAIEI